MINRFQAARIPVASSVWMSYGIPENQHEENGSQCTILPPKNSNYSYFFFPFVHNKISCLSFKKEYMSIGKHFLECSIRIQHTRDTHLSVYIKVNILVQLLYISDMQLFDQKCCYLSMQIHVKLSARHFLYI